MKVRGQGPRPPRLAEWLLGLVVGSDYEGRSIVGDAREEYETRGRSSRFGSATWYWGYVLHFAVTYRRGGKTRRHGTGYWSARKGGGGGMESILQDTKSGLRKLLSDRGTTFLVTLMLALGIGANTAIFSALRGSLLAGLPYENADGLVMVWLDNERQGIRTDITSYPSFELTRENATTLEDLGVYRPAFSTLSEGEPERVQSSRVGANVLGMLGVEPVRGRLFENREDLDGEEPTAILGDGLWRRRYGGDPDVVGTRIIVDGEPRTVVGVMPPGFDFPGDTELWMPMSLSEGA